MKRTMLMTAALLLALFAAGCSDTKQPAKPAATDEAAVSHVTAFGLVRCAESPVLKLPVEAAVVEVYAREGQVLAPHTPVLKLDTESLQRERERAGHELKALEASIESLTAQIKQAEADLAAAQDATKRYDMNRLLGILERLANAGSHTKRDLAEKELLECLKEIHCVDRYHSLGALAADKRRVRNNARPVLLALEAELARAARARESELSALKQSDEQARANVLPLREKAAIMEEIAGGATLCGIGSFDAAGVFTTGGRELVLLSALPLPGQAVAPGQALAAFGALDTREVTVNVEEQLISGVAVGADVQLSPLYDKGAVWIGTVTAVSGQAVIVNGETVVPVTVQSEDLALGPGYNATVKIFSK